MASRREVFKMFLSASLRLLYLSTFIWVVAALQPLSKKFYALRSGNAEVCAVDVPTMTLPTVKSKLHCTSQCLQNVGCTSFNHRNSTSTACQMYMFTPQWYSVIPGCSHYQDSPAQNAPNVIPVPEFRAIVRGAGIAPDWRIARMNEVSAHIDAVKPALDGNPWGTWVLADGTIGGIGYGYRLQEGVDFTVALSGFVITNVPAPDATYTPSATFRTVSTSGQISPGWHIVTYNEWVANLNAARATLGQWSIGNLADATVWGSGYNYELRKGVATGRPYYTITNM